MDSEVSMDLFRETVSQIAKSVPGFEIRYKDESWSSKVIAVLVWIFNREYMTRFTTTRYPRVYFPSREYVEASPMTATKILMHEFVHLWDRKQMGWWFSIGYMLPQALALVFIVGAITCAIWQPWWVAVISAACGVLCLLPLPAYWRMKFEMRGYTMNMLVNFYRYGFVRESTVEWITKQFTGSAYYFMWPCGAESRVRKACKLVADDELRGWLASYNTNDFPYLVAKETLRGS